MGGNKKKKKKVPVPLIVALCVCVVALGVSIWQLSDIFLEYKAGTDEYEELQQYVLEEIPEENETDTAETENDTEETGTEEEQVQRVALSELQAQNPDTVGWIEIPGTGISYPLMQADDNAYYLNHTFSGKVNSAGSIFMEQLNSSDFTDLHTIIYGHNMKNGSMFAGLKNYSSPSYLVSHPTVYLDLADGTHAYQIFSVYEAAADSDSYTIGFAPDEQYEEYLRTIKGRSEYDTGVDVTKDDFIITLSTCTRSGEDRYLVHAKKLW
ncbi:MAG TPA: class B sortase [Candidatus Merdisoma merdipullorum]|nr:class B sortase [Candidatus Merdisoma merdipullorum]